MPLYFLRETDILWTPEFEHPVQCVYGDRDFGCSTPIGARSQPITDDPFEPADVGLHQRSPVIAGGLLPSHATQLGDGLQVTVSHRRRHLRGVARHGAGAWWDDDGRLGVTHGDIAVDAINVVWSGTARSRPSKAMMEPISPSVCRSARRNTDRSVSAVAMARAE